MFFCITFVILSYKVVTILMISICILIEITFFF